MKNRERNGWLGEYEIMTTYKDGTRSREQLKNRITDAGLNMIRDAFLGERNDLQLKYFALGDSDLPLEDNQTQLGNERFRTVFVDQKPTGIGKTQSTAIVLDNEAVFSIREIGIFAGPATDEADSGIMISRILWNRDKTNLESIQFVRTDTLSRR